MIAWHGIHKLIQGDYWIWYAFRQFRHASATMESRRLCDLYAVGLYIQCLASADYTTLHAARPSLRMLHKHHLGSLYWRISLSKLHPFLQEHTAEGLLCGMVFYSTDQCSKSQCVPCVWEQTVAKRTSTHPIDITHPGRYSLCFRGRVTLSCRAGDLILEFYHVATLR